MRVKRAIEKRDERSTMQCVCENERKRERERKYKYIICLFISSTWVNEMNFVVNHAPGAGSIARSVG